MGQADASLPETTVSQSISFEMLGFERVPVQRFSSGGTPWTQWVATGMPRIDTKLLNLACYLYNSRVDAEAGRNFGGTAFLVAVPSAVPDRSFVYAITNWHVAVRDGASVLRLNFKDGGTDIFEFGPEDWVFDPRYDIAVRSMAFEDDRHARTQFLTSGFVAKEAIEHEHGLTPGEDVFMIGRFVDHDGGGVNFPTVRFGNISALPTPLKQPNGAVADVFLLDMHSRSGYSGSPVFVYRTPGYDLSTLPDGKSLLLAGTNYLALLGIHFAQFPEAWEIKDGEVVAMEGNTVPLIRGGKYVSGLSGMTCVLPAWCILEVLDMPELKAGRDITNAELLADQASSGKAVPNGESALPEAEIAVRRDASLARALSTPPKPFTPKPSS